MTVPPRDLLDDPRVRARIGATRAKFWIGIALLGAFALLWNAITWTVFFRAVTSPWRGGPASLVPGLFAIPFLLVGLAMLAGLVYLVLSLFNPQAHAITTPESPRLGEAFFIDWALTPHRRNITTLKISLRGQEVATSRRGTSSTTSRSVFFEQPLFETREPLSMRRGQLSVAVPADLVPSFKSKSNAIEWSVVVHGQIPRWPDLRATITLVVLPIQLPEREPGRDSTDGEPA